MLDVLAQHTDTDGGVKRSRTVMLVKALPFNTTEQELRDIFGKFGALGTVASEIKEEKVISDIEQVE